MFCLTGNLTKQTEKKKNQIHSSKSSHLRSGNNEMSKEKDFQNSCQFITNRQTVSDVFTDSSLIYKKASYFISSSYVLYVKTNLQNNSQKQLSNT